MIDRTGQLETRSDLPIWSNRIEDFWFDQSQIGGKIFVHQFTPHFSAVWGVRQQFLSLYQSIKEPMPRNRPEDTGLSLAFKVVSSKQDFPIKQMIKRSPVLHVHVDPDPAEFTQCMPTRQSGQMHGREFWAINAKLFDQVIGIPELMRPTVQYPGL